MAKVWVTLGSTVVASKKMYPLRWVLRRLRLLSARERRLLVEAALLLPSVHALQQGVAFKHWRLRLDRSGRSVRTPKTRPSVDEIVWSVRIAAQYLPGTYNCLPNAYAAHLLLHRYGYASQIHVGVARSTQGQIEAHAWLECAGRTVLGELDDMQRFVAFPPLASADR